MFNVNLLLELSTDLAKTIGIIVDIVLVVLVLAFVLRGLYKGFIESFLKILSSVGSIVVAIFTAKPVTLFLNKFINLSTLFGNMVSGMYSGIEGFDVAINSEEVRQTVLTSIENADAFPVLKGFMTNIISNADISVGATANTLISQAIGVLLATIAVGVIIFVAVKFIVFLLSKLFENKEDERGSKSGTDRVLGMVFGAIKAVAYVAVVMIITSLLSYIGFIGNPVRQVVNQTAVTKPIYGFVEDTIRDTIENQDWNEIIGEVIEKTSDNGEAE